MAKPLQYLYSIVKVLKIYLPELNGQIIENQAVFEKWDM